MGVSVIMNCYSSAAASFKKQNKTKNGSHHKSYMTTSNTHSTNKIKCKRNNFKQKALV